MAMVDDHDIAITSQLACAVDRSVCEHTHVTLTQPQGDSVVVLLRIARIRPDNLPALPVIGKIGHLFALSALAQSAETTAQAERSN